MQVLSRRVTIGISLAAVAVLSVVFRVWGALVTDDSLGIIRSQLAFTADRFEAVTGTWNIAEFIRLTATVDFIFPVLYAAVIAGVWARAAGSDQWSRSVWPAATAFGAAPDRHRTNNHRRNARRGCRSRRFRLCGPQVDRHRGRPHCCCDHSLEAQRTGVAGNRGGVGRAGRCDSRSSHICVLTSVASHCKTGHRRLASDVCIGNQTTGQSVQRRR